MKHVRAAVRVGLAAVAMVASSAASRAATVNYSYTGQGVSYALTLTTAADPNVGPWPPAVPSAPNAVDPSGAEIVVGVTGTFTDAPLRIFNAVVTGVEPLNRVSPESTNLLAPNSFSLLLVANGVHENGQNSLGLHYDNLYYPQGSPQTASDYPFHGGVFDIYGLAFTLDNNDVVNIWSNGVLLGVGLDYGVAVTDRINVLAPVPLPGSAAMFGAAVLALSLAGSGRKCKKAAAAA